MKLSLVFFIIFLLTLLSHADQTDNEVEFDSSSCLTSRRLLFFGGITNPFGEKKSEHASSSSKSSPPKYARADVSHGLTVYIRPQTSSELGHKVRSYSHLLKTKLFTKEERAKLKKLKNNNKSTNKKKNTSQVAPKTQGLVAINDQERDRCRALLQIDHQNGLIPTTTTTAEKQIKKVKNSISNKVKNATAKAKKQVAKVAKTLPIKTKESKTDKKEKVKPIKNKNKSTSERKGKSTTSSETTALTPPTPIVKEVPTKKPTTTIPPPPPPPPAPPASSKSKREKQAPPPIQEPVDSLDSNEQDEIDNEEQNHSVVNRAYSFVKNMFQLSDDILENNHTHTEEEEETDSILSSPPEQSNRPSRKLLSFIDERNLHDSNDLPFSFERIFKRQLLSVKTNKQSISSKSSTKKVKTTNYPYEKKPKVGWTYRYRISRFLADQKTKRSGGGKSKAQITNKKPITTNAKVSKRKLLEFNSNLDLNLEENEKSNQDIVDTVLITQEFIPKRQLLASKKAEKVKVEKNNDDDDDNDVDSSSDNDKHSERRRMKSYDALTDPVEIVRSYDRGLFKPRVGWQFRYRVSRYIDSLRENIREDQERLKLGLQAIKRKTPQELSGRRKRVLDKPFTPEPEETPDVVQENKPNVGWRYRYRISKMLDAKQRGEYIDDEELKRQARLSQKTKGQDKSSTDDDDCLEWEFDLDPELRKISEEGKRVGWAYRYRIRRKLDELKQRQTETGIPFDLETLGGGKREKKVASKETTSSKDITEEKPADANKKSVGWQYRYRVSKMLEAQKNEAADRLSKSRSKKQDQIPASERLDPVLAQLKPEDRVVGWEYRYRIRRKLDALNNANQESGAGHRSKKSKQSLDTRAGGKGKKNEEIIKKVEESIEKILNIDDIDETPFMEYFRRTSSYVFFGLVPTAKKSICLLISSDVLPFCNENEDVQPVIHTTTPTATAKLKTKKEKRAKQFIQSRPTKFEPAKEIIDEPVKPLSKVPKQTIEKPQRRSNNRRQTTEQIKHYDEEEHPVKKRIGVEAKKKNKKRFQIIGQEVKFKPKQTTTTTSAPVVQTTTVTPLPPPPPPPQPKIVLTTTSQPPVVQTTTAPPPPPSREPDIVLTTTPTTLPPLRTISEIIQEEAATLLTTPSSFVEETKEEINEANEIAQSTPSTTKIATPNDNSVPDNDNDTEDDSDSESTDSESSTDDDDDGKSSSEETNEKNDVDENFDPLAVKKMKKFYESAKESMHGVFDIKDEQNSP